MEEVWKDIDDNYQISNLGNVYSKKTKKILKQSTDGKGYPIFKLSNNNLRKTIKVHRLVAKAFIPNPDNLPCVNHKNELKNDNRASNLEWCSFKYNINYGLGITKRANNRKVSIIQLDLNGNIIREWNSARDASTYLNKLEGYKNICACCKGKKKSAYGFKWKYKE